MGLLWPTTSTSCPDLRRLLVDGANWRISAAAASNYYLPRGKSSNRRYAQSQQYAYGRDYHFVIKDKLELLHDMQQGPVGGRQALSIRSL
jgi:epoxyqueuosine reductase